MAVSANWGVHVLGVPVNRALLVWGLYQLTLWALLKDYPTLNLVYGPYAICG